MSTEGLIERLQATSAKCRQHAATASDPEVARSLLKLAEEMEAALSAVADDLHAQGLE